MKIVKTAAHKGRVADVHQAEYKDRPRTEIHVPAKKT